MIVFKYLFLMKQTVIIRFTFAALRGREMFVMVNWDMSFYEAIRNM